MNLTEKDLEFLERRLLEERARALAAIDRLRQVPDDDPGMETRFPLHLADMDPTAATREAEHLIAGQQDSLLRRIDRALELLRTSPDEYGTCEACGGAIEPARLELLPWTRLCIACGRGAESPIAPVR